MIRRTVVFDIRQFHKETVRGRMMKKRVCAVLCAATVLLTGCGAIDLTDSESDLISEYAATVLLKYSSTYQPKLQDKVVEPETTRALPSIPTTPSAELSETSSGKNETNHSDNSAAELSTKSLSEALGIAADGFSVEYAGYEVVEKYTDSKSPYLSIQVKSGSQRYLVLKFNITNQSGGEKECDILSQKNSYRCRVNDIERFGAQFTMLFDDLATFKEEFSAGETKQAVLIFQISSDYEGNIESLRLTVKGEEESNNYQCE